MDDMGEGPVNPMEKAAIRAAGAWGLEIENIRRDLAISGSPQRTEYRCVLECSDRRLVVLEVIRDRELRKKQDIIDRIDFLARKGLPRVHPYIPAPGGRHIVPIEGRLWQMSDYIHGIPLDRPAYALDGWRGKAMAEFLVDLGKAAEHMPGGLSAQRFSILGYNEVLMGLIKEREPRLVEGLAPITAFLRRRLAPVHDLLPAAFCHGDYHPLNMIWSGRGLVGVIDWEFSGMKPENYDAAVLIGCIGMETPDALAGPLVMEFVRGLKTAQVISERSWQVLVEMVIAIRFAWLSEWLRSRDTEMIELETTYMHLLATHADDLAALWRSW